MAFSAGYSSSCPCLRGRTAISDSAGRSKTAHLLARPGVRQVAAAAGEVVFAGEATVVQQQVSCCTSQAVPQQALTNQQTYTQPTQWHLPQQAHQHSHVLPLPSINGLQAHQQHPVNGHLCSAVNGVEDSPNGRSGSHSSSNTAYQDGDGLCQLQQLQGPQHPSAVGIDQQFPLLQQQDDDHHHHQQQQQHIDRLLSNTLASTPGTVSVASSSSRQDSASCTHVHRQEPQLSHISRLPQQLSLTLDSSSSTNSSSRGPSSSRELSGRQLVRPNHAHAGARCASPAQITAVANILRMKPAAAQLLLDRVPQLLQLQPTAMQEKVQQLSETLGITYKQAAFMSARQPEQLLFRPAQEFLQTAQQLAVAVGLPGQDGSLRGARVVINAATDAPALLVRPQRGLVKRLLAISSWFEVSAEAALRMVAAAPELLTDSWSGIQRRVQALRDILLLWPVAAQRLVIKYPKLLFLSPRIVNNKVKVLMAITHKDRKAIGLLVYKTPQLLRSELERVRVCYQLLPLLLERSEGFAYAMSAHSASLLLLPPPKLLVRSARILAAVQMAPQWQQQWQQQRPPQIQEGLAQNYQRFERLEYLVTTQQTDRIGVLEALKLNPQVFEQRFGGWASWWSSKQLRLQQYHQQQQQQQSGPGRGPRLQLPPPQQQPQQQFVAEGLGLTSEQHQLQQQYQQLVHEQLRQLHHKHRQRQMHHQQCRAQLLHQRTLRWQQLQQHLQRRQQQQLQQQRQQAPDEPTQEQQQQQEQPLLATAALNTCYSNSSSDSSTSSSYSTPHISSLEHVPAVASSIAAAVAAAFQHDQQLLRQQMVSDHTAAAAAECTVDSSVVVQRASALAAAAVEYVDSSTAAVDHLDHAAGDDIVVMPQQRGQQQHWKRQQHTASLLNGRRQQQQRVWQPAAVAKGL